MKTRFCRVAVLLLVFFVSVPIFAQEISERREVAIFGLNYFGAPVGRPPETTSITVETDDVKVQVDVRGSGDEQTDQLFQQTLGAVDQEIREVFVNLGRFDIIGLPQKLSQDDVSDFIDAIREFKEADAEMPEAVLLGREAFTEADFNRLVGGFVVVIPSVTYYNAFRNDSGDYEAELATSFTILNVDTLQTIAQFTVETDGYDANQATAVRDAVDEIANELRFEITSIDEFRLRTIIAEVDGSEIVMQFGQDMGVSVGDEYNIVRQRTTSAGFETQEATALVIVKDVQDVFSTGYLVYADPEAFPGDQLVEIPRFGFEFMPYANFLIDVGTESISAPIIGFRGIASRGFFDFRPVANIEVNLGPLIAGAGLPLLLSNVMVGGELNLYLGRLKIVPSAAVGVGLLVPIENPENFAVSHLGGTIKAQVQFLVEDNLLVFGEAGWSQWFSLVSGYISSSYTDTYGGPTVGAGVIIK